MFVNARAYTMPSSPTPKIIYVGTFRIFQSIDRYPASRRQRIFHERPGRKPESAQALRQRPFRRIRKCLVDVLCDPRAIQSPGIELRVDVLRRGSHGRILRGVCLPHVGGKGTYPHAGNGRPRCMLILKRHRHHLLGASRRRECNCDRYRECERPNVHGCLLGENVTPYPLLRRPNKRP